MDKTIQEIIDEFKTLHPLAYEQIYQKGITDALKWTSKITSCAYCSVYDECTLDKECWEHLQIQMNKELGETL